MKDLDLTVLDARAVIKEVLSAKEFISLRQVDKEQIESVNIVAPKLGDSGFGGVLVKYKSPIYKVF